MSAATASYRRPPLSPLTSLSHSTKDCNNERHLIPRSPTSDQVDKLHSDESVSAESSLVEGDVAADGRDALMDLAQLEELHNEAERMKALGNKHMAAQGRWSNIPRRRRHWETD